jgi:hypothetical protein
MKRRRIRWPIAGVATAILLLSACGNGDDSSTTASEPSSTTSEAARATTLASGEDVELVGGEGSGLGYQQLNVTAEEERGEVTGEFRITENAFRIDCADTHTDNVVILGGEATGGPDVAVGDLLALIIREGDPDSVALWANDSGAEACTGMLKSMPDDLLTDDSNFVDVEDGYDIQTG